jgi:hypothetical protein
MLNLDLGSFVIPKLQLSFDFELVIILSSKLWEHTFSFV